MTDTITYFTTIIGAFRAGVCAFLISTRNAAVAVADMAKRTGLTHFIVSPDSITNEVADEAIKMLASEGMDVKKHRMPVFEDLFPQSLDANSLFEKEVEFPKSYDPEAFSSIMHSSGLLHRIYR